MDEISIKEYFESQLRIYKAAHEHEHELLNQNITLARDALNVRLEHMNEFRAQTLSERSEFVNKDKFDTAHRFLVDRVVELEQQLASFKGRILGIGSAVAVMLVVLQILLRFFVK